MTAVTVKQTHSGTFGVLLTMDKDLLEIEGNFYDITIEGKVIKVFAGKGSIKGDDESYTVIDCKTRKAITTFSCKFNTESKALTHTKARLKEEIDFIKNKYDQCLTYEEELVKFNKENAQGVLDNARRMTIWKELRDVFGFTPPLDGIISAVSNKVSLDVIKLDKMLNVPNGISTRNFITEKYGKEISDKVKQLI
jgi:hypothetical protein